ncbi:MAG: flavodoxin-dependent (E)-4-hydroxy-3-methylbut-2-enyl-diphosphate synthase, partial [Ignavibacteriae bacterium]|nr:flavodoxin-dependent (E)-4-hydroxy-3-methylbut-2-enyl-diphosphate synthase [Ignavibacteriota bacterium]
SALEFVRICEDENYNNIVLSMKSSNPQVIIEAYRFLVKKMIDENMNYPLHLGVTEAGDGEDGRIKSAMGIGTLLEEGIGDTIRVSLTEEPEFEIPVCKILVEKVENLRKEKSLEKDYSILQIAAREYKTNAVDKVGWKNVPVVIINLDKINYQVLKNIGYFYSETLDKWNISDTVPDYIYAGSNLVDVKLPCTLKIIYNYPFWKSLKNKENSIPIICQEEYISTFLPSEKFVLVSNINDSAFIEKIKKDSECILVLKFNDTDSMSEMKEICKKITELEINSPFVLAKTYNNITEDKFVNYASIDIGGIFIDGFGNGIWLESPTIDNKTIVSVSFGILQAARKRISKTEYISCPSCGRTLFDLQETTAKVRLRTNHLKGLKIAIMGCTDADYGYVGSGIGKITLYKGKEVVKRNINTDIAVDELINLIKENGDWIEPK